MYHKIRDISQGDAKRKEKEREMKKKQKKKKKKAKHDTIKGKISDGNICREKARRSATEDREGEGERETENLAGFTTIGEALRNIYLNTKKKNILKPCIPPASPGVSFI